MGSLAGLYPQISTVYGGQKGAIHRIAQSLRVELSGSRVKVTEICPGRTKTNFAKAAFEDKTKAKKFMSGFTLLEAKDVAETSSDNVEETEVKTDEVETDAESIETEEENKEEN